MASAAPRSEGRIDFGRTLGFVFEDPDWLKKMLIGGLMAILSMVMVGSFLVIGYFMRVIRRSARGETRPLPDWDDWGGIFMDGLLAIGVYIVHVFVLMLPLGLGFGCFIGIAAAGAGSQKSGGAALGAVAGLGMLALYAFFFVALMALMVYLPAVLTRLAILGRFGAAFEVRENVAFIRRNLGDYFLALVMYLVASFIAQFGVILLCIGIFPLSFWAYCVLAYPLGLIAGKDPVLGAAARALEARP